MRIALQLYCSRIYTDIGRSDKGKSPVILACNHPNSFLDAMIIGAYYPRKLYFLARGDAFINPFVNRIFKMLRMIPIYRISEGRHRVKHNHNSFNESIDILKKNGVILIFSEGICVNEWKLRPLKKGTARLAWQAWQENKIDNMLVRPLAISYHSFSEAPKRIVLKTLPALDKSMFAFAEKNDFYRDFNSLLTSQLEEAVPGKNHELLKPYSNKRPCKILLAVPALVGYAIHKPFYKLCCAIVRGRTAGTVFYDSVLFAVLLFVYPLLVIATTGVAVYLTGTPVCWLLLPFLPFSVWAYNRYRHC